jgi:hypothetical protein
MYKWAVIYTLNVQSLNPKYIVFYATQKGYNRRCSCVNRAPSNLLDFVFFV